MKNAISYEALIHIRLLWQEIIREGNYFDANYAADPDIYKDTEAINFYRESLQSSLDHALRRFMLEASLL